MTVKEICEKLEDFTDDERQRYAGALCKMLSPVSMQTLCEFQNSWDGTKPPVEFFAAQAAQIKTCVELEVAHIGQIVRQETGLEPLTWETEVAA